MEYKSELIDFEKEDMESKKRMLGSDKVNNEYKLETHKLTHDLGQTKEFKVNIKDIKERVALRAHMKTLCNAPRFEGTINYNGAEDDVVYLLSIISQAEKALIVAVKHVSGIAETFGEREKIPVLFQLDEALQAIRK